MSGAQCIVQRGTRLRLDADHLRAAGVPRGNAADQSAAAGCHQHMGQFRRVLFELPSDRALAGQHVRMIIGMHLQRAGLRLAVARRSERVGIGRADLHHARAITRDARHLHHRRRLRNEDLRPGTQRTRGIGDRRTVVAAGCRDHPGRWKTRRQQPVERAARLEAARMLQELELQRHRESQDPSPRRRREGRACAGHGPRSAAAAAAISFRLIMATTLASPPRRRQGGLPIRHVPAHSGRSCRSTGAAPAAPATAYC